MSVFFTFMAAPAVACLILVLVLTFFGCHVLKREIIFVDISLAQLAALGTTVAFILEIDLDSPISLLLSLLFILMGGVFFAFTRTLSPRVPQEAVIGIIYVVGASFGLLLVANAPHGAEHLKALLNGSILWITWPGTAKLALACALVFIPVWRNRVRLEQQSEHYRGAPDRFDFKLDFLFYTALGLVIVFSVRTAGIFLIFSFLILPAVCGALFFSSLTQQFLAGSVVGVLTSWLGLILSFYLDLPTGATLVCLLGAAFFLAIPLSRLLVKT